MAVQVEQEQLEPCRVALTIGVTPEHFQKAVDSVFNQFAKRTSVPGFRPGKAPKHLLKRFIDEGQVREMALDRALNDAYRDALREAGVEPYQHAEPAVELPEEEVDPEKGFTFKATIALQPHVHLGDLEGLTARRVVTKISDEDVQKELTRICEQAATYEPTEEPARETDRVRATVRVTVDGNVIEEASFEEPTLIQLGANLPELDAGLTGMKAGEEKSFEFTFPEDFPDEELRGKQATAEVSVTEVHRHTVPEASDELAQRAGFEDLQALNEFIRESLQRQADSLADQELEDNLVREVVSRSEAHYPSEMVDHEVSDRMSNLIKALERRSLTLEDYLAGNKKDLTTLQEEVRKEAEESLVNTLVLLELARNNDVRVTEKDVEDEVKLRAEQENVKVSQMRRLLNDTGEITSVRNRIFFRKVAEFLRSKAEIREVEA